MSRAPSYRLAVSAFLLAAAPAQGFLCDFQPIVREQILNTNFQQITCGGGPPVNVSGGIFTFRSVRIPAGVTVRGTGTNPLILIVLNDVIIDGELSVSGGDGARVDTLNSANIPTPGGVAGCTAGNGGRGSPSTVGTDLTGEAGFGPMQVMGSGGAGGLASCTPGFDTGRASGGGGGSFATVGDPYYKRRAVGNSMVQQLGGGGLGGLMRLLAGGNAGRASSPTGYPTTTSTASASTSTGVVSSWASCRRSWAVPAAGAAATVRCSAWATPTGLLTTRAVAAVPAVARWSCSPAVAS